MTFIAVVTFSVIVGTFLSGQMYKNRVETDLSRHMSGVADRIVLYYKTHSPSEVSTYLNDMANLQDTNVEIINDEGVVQKYYSRSSDSDTLNVDASAVQTVLNGRTLTPAPSFGEAKPKALMVGKPFEVGQHHYALFIQPAIHSRLRDINLFSVTVFLVVLVIGSLLILVISRFMVRPLVEITGATKELAQGNFNVRLNINRNDEIGTLARSFNQMAQELQKVEQMRQDFVANVSHEIQSPLTSIRGFASALKDGIVADADKGQYLDIIYQESTRLSQLGESLLKLASLDSDHHPFTPTRYRLDEQLRQIVAAHDPQLSGKNLNIQLSLPRTFVVADEELLSHVWRNLLSNSIRYTPNGGTITVEIFLEEDQVVARFADTGIGIPAVELEHIFDRFYKVDKSRGVSREGNGLGLAIAQKIVRMHQGKIEVSSEMGKGSLFQVVLPNSSELTKPL